MHRQRSAGLGLRSPLSDAPGLGRESLPRIRRQVVVTTPVMEARGEPISDKRPTLYGRIAVLVKDEAFGLPVANQVDTFAPRKNLHDFAARSTG